MALTYGPSSVTLSADGKPVKRSEFEAILTDLWIKSQIPLTLENLVSYSEEKPRTIQKWLGDLAELGAIQQAEGSDEWLMHGRARPMDGPESIEQYQRLKRLRSEAKQRVRSEWAAKQAKKRLEQVNPRVKIKSFHEELSTGNVFLIESEVVVDATNQPEVNKLIFAHCQEKKIPLIYVRYSGSRIKVLVANKKLAQKDFDWLEDVGNVTKEGVYAGTAMFGAMIIINRIYKFFLGDNSSYQIEADAWEGEFKRTKL